MPSGKDLVTRMQARLKGQGYEPLGDRDARMYGSNFKKLMASDNPCREAMEELVDTLVDDWGRSYLASPQKIYREDVRGYYESVEDGEGAGETKKESRAAALAKMGPFKNTESLTAASRMDSTAPEGNPEGSTTTPEDTGAQDESWTVAVDRMAVDPESKAVRFARAALRGKKDGETPITTQHVAKVVADEIDVEALGYIEGVPGKLAARTLASMLIWRLRDQ